MGMRIGRLRKDEGRKPNTYPYPHNIVRYYYFDGEKDLPSL
jgi:hypothetical protein